MAHRALNSFDILLEIFENLWPSTCLPLRFLRREERRTLARCARVCRSFSEPALRVLWRTLDDLNPPCQLLGTLKILNIDCIGDGNVTEKGFRTLLPPEIPQQAWARFQQYASYVRIVQGLLHQSNSSLWIVLASRTGDQPLFPCLRSIELRLDDSSCTKMLCLMAPSINSLTIFTDPHDDDDQNLDAMLKAVSTISPNAVWTLRTSSPSLFRHTHFSHFSALHKVEVVCPSDTTDLFEKLSCLDYLNDLVINHEVGMGRQIGRGCFAALQNVQFWILGGDPLAELLTDFSFPRLQSVFISIDGPSDITANRRILDALCSGSPSLCVLTITCGQRRATEHPLMMLLEPLLALSGMKELEIGITAPLSVSKDDIGTMARSWPGLRKLSIGYSFVDPVPPIQSIVEFVHHCPQLQQLCFPRFSCVSRTFPATSVPSPHCKRWLELRRLDIDFNDVELCRKAAEFIEGIFIGEEDWGAGMVRESGWQTVRSLINKRRASRKSLTGFA